MSRPAARDLTVGSIPGGILGFAVPLMLGNVFQLLYNTVDVWVVGNYVGTQALAAVGSTTLIVNMLVFFFDGFSVGAGVLIGFYFGAREPDRLHTAVETAVAATLIACVGFTALGVAAVRPMLRLMATPEDVMPEAALYLTIYVSGISGLLVYNVGSGILRAVGDTRHPLFFLVLTSLLNTVLDLFFVVRLHAGIAGVAAATILSQFISAALVLLLLTRTGGPYRLVWRDLTLDRGVLRRILSVGLPAGLQAVVTAFSNIFVQSYVNAFGSACMAGWSCYNRLDQFILLPMQSMSMAATAFVSQNVGARQPERADRGTRIAVLITIAVTGGIAAVIFANAPAAIGLFSADPGVIAFGALFLHANVLILPANSVSHVVAGSLRGQGDSRGPMVIMLSTYVLLRQAYLFVMTRFIANTPLLVGLGYPVGWIACCAATLIYARNRRRRRKEAALTA